MYKYESYKPLELTEEEEDFYIKQIMEFLDRFSKSSDEPKDSCVADTDRRNREYISACETIADNVIGENVTVNDDRTSFLSNFCNISVTGDSVEFSRDSFIDVVMKASNFEVYPEYHRVHIDFGFYGIDKENLDDRK